MTRPADPWNITGMRAIFGQYETISPEKETEPVSRAFFRQWVLSGQLSPRSPASWKDTIRRQTGEERRRIWTEVLQEIIDEGELWPKPEPEPAIMLEYDEVAP